MFATLRKRGLHWGALCGAAGAGLALLLTSAGAFDAVEMRLLDRRYRASPAYAMSREVAIVGLDDKELRRFSPYPREVLAKVVRRLHSYGARVIALDVLLDSRRPESEAWEDLALLDAMAEAGNVVLPVTLEGRALIEPHPFFRAVAAGAGHVHGEQSPTDRVVRAFRPVMLPPHSPQPLPAVALVAVRLAKRETLEKATGFASYAEVARTLRLPLDDQGQLRLRFLASAPPAQPARELLAGDLPADWFRDRIVFVGVTAEGFRDRHRTPFTRRNESGTPGVVIQALAASALLEPRPLRNAPWTAQFTVLAATSIVLGVLCFLLPTLCNAPAGLLASIAMVVAGQRLFDRNALVIAESPVTAALLICPVLCTVVRYGFLERAARHARKTFGRYLHPRVVEEVLEHSGSESLGRTRRCTVTILFSDIRSYTKLSADKTPEQIVSMLNDYFTLMSKEVLDRDGFIDKYLGDGMMALFGFFADTDDGALAAVRAAVAMRDVLAAHQHNENLRFQIGIGLHTGEIVAGEMGSPQHRDYTVIGADVNLASRVEAMTKELKAGILMTQATYDLVGDQVEVVDRGEQEIRGFEGRTFRLFELVRAD